MTGDIGYANQRFSVALRYLARGDKPYRERLTKAFGEAVHMIDYDNSRPIPPDLHARMHEFFRKGPHLGHDG